MALTASSPVKKSSSEENGSLASPNEGPPPSPPQAASEPRKRTKCPGVRVVGGRIYDSENGKTCHQCRQKTRDFVAACTQLKKGKMCTIKFCHKCLLNRYGEKAEEVAALDNWSCPKCRGICNCSFCMKKKGQKPTGIMIHAAKATGFSSVLELLDNQGADALAAVNLMKMSSPCRPHAAEKKKTTLKRSRGDEGGVEKRDMSEVMAGTDENIVDIDLNALPTGRSKKRLKGSHKGEQKDVEVSDDMVKCTGTGDENSLAEDKAEPLPSDEGFEEFKNEVVMLPKGTPVTEVAGIELHPEDVGPALQFLEFCRTFSKVFQIKKGQPECILQEVAKGGIGRRGVSSAVAQFHINLLSVIQTDSGEKPLSNSARSGDAWVTEVGKYISESKFVSKELPLDCFNQGSLGYDSLGSSGKLCVLNFLCDETLCTEKLRSWIDKENERATERKKMAKEKVLAAKRKEKELKERLKNDMAKAMLSEKQGVSLTVSEHENLISKIKEETKKAEDEILDILELLPNKTELRDALRTEPMILEGNGEAYWKLEGYCSNSIIMLQEIENWELIGNEDKWFTFEEEDEKIIEDHIATIRSRRRRKHTRNGIKMN